MTALGRVRRSVDAPPPMAWFLPGPIRMRGGAARRFASGWHFHRGIQAEATCRTILEKATHCQRLAKSRPWRAGFFCGIGGIQFVEATMPEASQRKPACHEPSKHRFDTGRGGIRASPYRDFTGPSAATPRQLCTPRVARTHRQRRRPRPMAMGGKGDASDGHRRLFEALRRPGCGLTLCALFNKNDPNEADAPMRQR